MVALTDLPKLTPEEYLELEAKSTTKHEYRNGEMYAMAGTTDTHNTIALNLAILLRTHLRGTQCQVYFADVKTQIDQRNYYYPDLLVTCDPRDRQTATYKSHPKVIIEILSESTEAFDRGDKFNDYQTLATLEEYVLVSSKRQRVEVFQRSPQFNIKNVQSPRAQDSKGPGWLFQSYAAQDGTFRLASLEMMVEFAELYEGVEVAALQL